MEPTFLQTNVDQSQRNRCVACAMLLLTTARTYHPVPLYIHMDRLMAVCVSLASWKSKRITFQVVTYRRCHASRLNPPSTPDPPTYLISGYSKTRRRQHGREGRLVLTAPVDPLTASRIADGSAILHQPSSVVLLLYLWTTTVSSAAVSDDRPSMLQHESFPRSISDLASFLHKAGTSSRLPRHTICSPLPDEGALLSNHPRHR